MILIQYAARLLLLTTTITSFSSANVTLAPLFRDSCVLQRGKAVPVWGWADPGEKITVSFGGQTFSTKTDADGRWRVSLAPLEAASKGSTLTVAGNDIVVVCDVVVGDVWLCSGQSNMNRSVKGAANAAEEIAAGDHPLIRHIRIQRKVAPKPIETASGQWEVATPQTVGDFTAVGYYFARDAASELGVPIGIIHNSYSGTPVESWLPETTLRADPAFAPVFIRWQKLMDEYPAKRAAYDMVLSKWKESETAARRVGEAALVDFQRTTPEPKAPYPTPGSSWAPSVLYNSMVHPLAPFALKGVLWYQGESNAERFDEYHRLFSSMIGAWRDCFEQGNIPFYWVQLANFKAGDGDGRNWAFLREAQARTLALPETDMITAIDIGDPDDIHPKNKQDVGHRLWRVARAKAYNLSGESSGPRFERVECDGALLRVYFTHSTGGLVVHGDAIQSLEVASDDRKFVPAIGMIEGNTLVVSAPGVKTPVAVRYAWTNSPNANLYNGAGLPAFPFRSDNWPAK